MQSSGKFNLLQSKSNKAHVERITTWIQAAMAKISSSVSDSNNDWNIMVTEIQCNDPSCVPIETLVVIIGSKSQKYSNKILKPIPEVVESDVEEVMIAWEFYRLSSQDREYESLGMASELAEVKAMIAKHLNDIEDKERKVKYLSAIDQLIQREMENVIESDMDDELPELVDGAEESNTDAQDITIVPMMSKSSVAAAASSNPIAKPSPVPLRTAPPVRHEKGQRGPRGCPCCDPDNIENITDRMLFFDTPP
jgi:hypothetical protein